MAELSDAAHALRTGIFLNPRASLTMQNESKELSPAAAAAMQELIDGGFVAVKADGKARTYTLTEAGEGLPKKSLTWMQKHGRIPLTQPIGGGNG